MRSDSRERGGHTMSAARARIERRPGCVPTPYSPDDRSPDIQCASACASTARAQCFRRTKRHSCSRPSPTILPTALDAVNRTFARVLVIGGCTQFRNAVAARVPSGCADRLDRGSGWTDGAINAGVDARSRTSAFRRRRVRSHRLTAGAALGQRPAWRDDPDSPCVEAGWALSRRAVRRPDAARTARQPARGGKRNPRRRGVARAPFAELSTSRVCCNVQASRCRSQIATPRPCGYGDPLHLLRDLRAMGETSALADAPPPSRARSCSGPWRSMQSVSGSRAGRRRHSR